MKVVREEALNLRIRGFSLNEINKKLGVPKSTLSGWLHNVALSKEAQVRIQKRVNQGVYNGLIKRNKLQTQEAQKRAEFNRAEARKQVSFLGEKDLLVIGATLYWAEGYKRLIIRNGRETTSHSISFVNADPVMVRTFIKFLREILHVPVDRICLYMRLYPGINENKARLFWTKATGLSESCFRKSTFLVSLASKGSRPYTRLPYGTLQIHVADTQKFYRLMGFIDGVKEKF